MSEVDDAMKWARKRWTAYYRGIGYTRGAWEVSRGRDDSNEVMITAEAYRAGHAARDAEVAALRADAVPFIAAWAAHWAREQGLPEGHLHPTHYDILEKFGGNVEQFTRAALERRP